MKDKICCPKCRSEKLSYDDIMEHHKCLDCNTFFKMWNY